MDIKNQLTNATPVGNQTYNGNGNVTASVSVSQTFGYDDENRLTTNELAFNLRTVFTYDGLGRLRQRDEYAWAGAPYFQCFIVNGASVRYIYDGMRVIQERDDSNVPTVSYTRGSDLSGSLEEAGGIGGLLARSYGYSGGNWSTHNSYHADGNGNITYLVNSSQTVAASYRYDPYGNTISSSGGLASANVYRFSSKEIHVNSGLYYYGYRWYHPNLQRWLNRDPIGELGAINLYGFVHNNPVNSVDLYGLSVFGDAWEVYKLLTSGPCGAGVGAVASKIYFKKQEDARYAHCMVSCKIADWCGKDIATVAGVAKEFYDLIVCALQGLRTGKWNSAQCESAFQPNDFKDNEQGVSCPPDKTCQEQCEDLKTAPQSDPGPFYEIFK